MCHYILCCQAKTARHFAPRRSTREERPPRRLPETDRVPILAAVASRSVTRAGQVLDDLVNRLDFRERLREHAVWNVWQEVVGDLLASKAEPVRIDDGKLFVRVANSAWMQELQFLTDDIRRRLNHRLGAPIVRELFLILGAGKRRKRKDLPLKIHPVDESAIAALVPAIEKPEIEAALRRLARARARRLGSVGGAF
jgi:predicted nucleic acid-binding Zn ribbon protein